jgi:UDP-N-acetylmuramyl pentapeptide phosphotransferase/UDP-N-acetylglucosamine-1-phosphate transferase
MLALALLAAELFYFKIADKYNIIDKPNNRSSHTTITLRGGGIVFPIAILMAFALRYVSWELTAAVVLVASISFIDDIKPLSQLPRFASHLFAVLLVFYDLDLFSFEIWIFPIVFVLLIGWINAFNFIDGINGITVLYALVSILSFGFVSTNVESLPLLITLGLSCVVFGIFNVRKKAKTFAGDVGSISMALFLGYFMIKTIIDSGHLGYILFFSVYGIESVVTIFKRLMKRENIFQPHRSHLYQYLVNEMKYSHVGVATIYAVLQLGVNMIVTYLIVNDILSFYLGIGFLLIMTLIYILVRSIVIRRIKLKNI